MPDPVDRLNAALEGRYRIEREIGEGGMATVYLADDLRHERRVALKVLKPELAAVVGAERFLAEIKTTAKLQHPHILPLHDSGEAGGFVFYVMPYVEGESLREKLERERQLGVEEALALACKVADALDYAHEQGVVHRDIKPANILLSGRGEPLVADFGIALAVAEAGGGRLTETGLSLGTPHYMSPEQAAGDRDVDRRSDVYALACVLYEMLAGEPPFAAPTAQAVLARILTEDARPVTELRRTVPQHVAAALRKALEKLPADRFRSAAAFADALGNEGFSYRSPGARPPAAEASGAGAATLAGTGSSARPWLRDPRSVVVLAALALSAVLLLLRPAPEAGPAVTTRARIDGLEISRYFGWRLAISPDGRWIAAGGTEDGEHHLFVRRAGDTEWRRLPGTENATQPEFSPDGSSLAFFHDGIFRVPVAGGPGLPVVESGTQPQWTPDGTIVYQARGAIYRVSASGGDPKLLFASDTLSVQRPHLLPNGRGVLFGEDTGGDPTRSRVLLAELETGEVRVLAASGNQPRYLSTGHVIYGHGDQALMGMPFDLETMEPTGPPVTLIGHVSVQNGGASQFDVSETGTLIYDTSGAAAAGTLASLVEVALDGSPSSLSLPSGELTVPRYSPDGRWIAYENGRDVHVYDLVTGATRNITRGFDLSPQWSPSGDFLYFSRYDLAADIFRIRVEAGEEPVRLLERPGNQFIQDVANGDSVYLVLDSHERDMDLVLLRIGPDGADVRPFLAAEWDEYGGQISPDGRWLAYQSDESGESRVYVRGFPAPTEQIPVSPGRGLDPVWSPDGGTIYFRAGTRFFAVEVTPDPAFTVSEPEPLFDASGYLLAGPSIGPGRNWDLHPDGDRFVLVRPVGDAEEASPLLSRVYIAVNWFEELKERMAGG